MEVIHALTQEELSALLLNVLQKRENGLEAKQDTLELKVVELSDRINVLVDKIEDMQKKQGCPCYIFFLICFYLSSNRTLPIRSSILTDKYIWVVEIYECPSSF